MASTYPRFDDHKRRIRCAPAEMSPDDRNRNPPTSGNLLAGLPQTPLSDERFDPIADRAGVRIERIVSTGQRSPDGFWYDQPSDEWVTLLLGRARLRLAAEPAVRELAPGDWVLIPAGCRHRVEWTSVEPPAVWLAIHLPPDAGSLRPE